MTRNPRLALHELARHHQLDRAGTQALFEASGLEREPPGVQRWLWPAVAVLAAALGGLGVIFWLASNWASMGRAGQFALLQGVLAVMYLGAATRLGLRAPLGLLALLCTGGLLAYFGQTYQTGADPWQLFAAWALLTLPLCLGVRSDVLWAPWSLVVMLGLSLWTYAHTGHQWHVRSEGLTTYALAWFAMGVMVLALSPALARHTGAGKWALRTAATLAVFAVTGAAMVGLVDENVAPHFPLALGLLAVAAALLAQRRAFDVFVLSAVALALNLLVVAGLAQLMWSHPGRTDWIGMVLATGLGAAGLLAASVSAIMRLARRHATGAAA